MVLQEVGAMLVQGLGRQVKGLFGVGFGGSWFCIHHMGRSPFGYLKH